MASLKLSRPQAGTAVLLLAMALRLASPQTANLSYLVLATYALFGRSQVIQALGLSWFFTMVNPGIAPHASLGSVGRYAIIATAAASLLARAALAPRVARVSRLVAATLALGAFLVLHSVLFSAIPDVSILKAISWTVVATVLLSAWTGLPRPSRERLERQVFRWLTLLILLSLPLSLSHIGYLRNGVGFQGLLAHPNAFGPTAAMLAAWLVGRLVTGNHPRSQDMVLLAVCLVFIVMSQARTAGLALVLGATASALVFAMVYRVPIRTLMPGFRSTKLRILALLSAGCLIFLGPALLDKTSDYLLKRSHTHNFQEAMVMSRGDFVYHMLSNIEKHPLSGIGFGIASDPSTMIIQRDPILDLPTGAPVEKGVMALAVLEELGAFGFSLVVMWIALVVRCAARSGFAQLIVVSTILFTNFGEATLFSPGGLGLLYLLLLAWSATQPSWHRQEQTPNA